MRSLLCSQRLLVEALVPVNTAPGPVPFAPTARGSTTAPARARLCRMQLSPTAGAIPNRRRCPQGCWRRRSTCPAGGTPTDDSDAEPRPDRRSRLCHPEAWGALLVPWVVLLLAMLMERCEAGRKQQGTGASRG